MILLWPIWFILNFFYNNSQMYKWQIGKQGMHFIELPYIPKVVVKKHECKKIISISCFVSCSVRSCSVRFCFVRYCSVRSCSVRLRSCSVRSCSVRSCSVRSCSVRSCSVRSCSVRSCSVRSCSVRSCSVRSWRPSCQC